MNSELKQKLINAIEDYALDICGKISNSESMSYTEELTKKQHELWSLRLELELIDG